MSLLDECLAKQNDYRESLYALMRWVESELLKFGERVETPEVPAPTGEKRKWTKKQYNREEIDYSKKKMRGVLTHDWLPHRGQKGLAALAGEQDPGLCLVALNELVDENKALREDNTAWPKFKLP